MSRGGVLSKPVSQSRSPERGRGLESRLQPARRADAWRSHRLPGTNVPLHPYGLIPSIPLGAHCAHTPSRGLLSWEWAPPHVCIFTTAGRPVHCGTTNRAAPSGDSGSRRCSPLRRTRSGGRPSRECSALRCGLNPWSRPLRGISLQSVVPLPLSIRPFQII